MKSLRLKGELLADLIDVLIFSGVIIYIWQSSLSNFNKRAMTIVAVIILAFVTASFRFYFKKKSLGCRKWGFHLQPSLFSKG